MPWTGPSRPRAAGRLAALLAVEDTPALLADIAAALARPGPALVARLDEALETELPLLKRDGGFVRAGFRADLDEARALRDESRRVIAGLQARYVDESGVRALKVKHNNVLGYFI